MIGHLFWLAVAAVIGSLGGVIHAHLVHARRVRARLAARQRAASERRPE
jgi:hypothetical protein